MWWMHRSCSMKCLAQLQKKNKSICQNNIYNNEFITRRVFKRKFCPVLLVKMKDAL
ncbi:unnamed protein product [Musa banksii]